jgi:hypothetical protein
VTRSATPPSSRANRVRIGMAQGLMIGFGFDFGFGFGFGLVLVSV